MGLIIEHMYDHNVWTSCVIHNSNLMEEFEAQIDWIKELAREAREIIKFISDHHQSQVMF